MTVCSIQICWEGTVEGFKNLINQLSSKLTLQHHSLKLPSVDPNSHSFQLIGLITAILVAAYLINFLLVRSVLGQRYRIFVAPGVILHEISHAFFCVLTRAKIKKIALFDKEGGHVEHEPSKLPVIGQILISFAPFLFGSLAIFFLSKYIGIKESQFSLTQISVDSLLQVMVSSFKQLNVGQWQTWAIIYVVLSIAVTMTPSRKDFENVFLSVIAISVAVFAFFQFVPLHQGFVGHASDKLTNFALPAALLSLLGNVLILLILALVLSIVVFVFSKLIKHK